MKRRRFLRVAAAGAAAGAAGANTGARAAGRKDAAVGDTPLPEVSWSRRLPVRYEADVAVIGGGIAGVSAACAAARSGASVILVERFAVTGGNMTTGGVANFCGDVKGQGEVFDAILRDLTAWGAIRLPKTVFDHEILAIVLQEMVLRRKVKLLLHTRFVDVLARDGRIGECIVCGPSGPEALRAKAFIDCTGEGEVAHRAGFATMKGRPEDGLQLPMSVMTFVRHVDKKRARTQLPDGWFEPCRTKKDLPMTSPWPNGPGSTALKIKIPMFDSTDTESMTAAEVRGDTVLRVADLRAGREFDDAVARGSFYLDGHKPDDDKRTYILSKKDMQVPPYQIPFRSLVARDGRNLLMAGRCFSADQLALSSARVSTTCSMMGQATGIAAAMAIGRKCDVRNLDYADVRRLVVERGARLGV